MTSSPPLPVINSPSDLNYDLLALAPRLSDFNIYDLHVLNLGSNNGEGTFGEQVRSLPFRQLDNIEIYRPALEELVTKPHLAQKVTFHNWDAISYVHSQPDKSVDVAFLFDIIEHFTSDEAWTLIRELKRVTRKRIIMFLPFGETPQGSIDGNEWQEHKSTWSTADFSLPDTKVEVTWRHLHVVGHPYAGFVTWFLDDNSETSPTPIH